MLPGMSNAVMMGDDLAFMTAAADEVLFPEYNVKQMDFISTPRIIVARYVVCWPRPVCTFGEFTYLCFWGDVCAYEASFQ